jgi:hypothetical protein
MSVMRAGALVVAAGWALGCSEEPRVFVADAGPRDVGVAVDAGAAVDTGAAVTVDAGVAVDRPPVQTVRDFVRPGAPTDSPARFDGAESAAGAPSVVYPENETVIPPNLPSFDIHFRPGAGNDLFEVSFAGAVTVARFYTRCAPLGGGCALTLNDTDLAQVADAARGRGSVTVTVRGTRSPDGSTEVAAVGRSEPITLGVTRDSLRGAVYWWASSGSIVRYDLGTAGSRPELFLRGDLINCVGCHALSRDGTRMWAGRGPIPGLVATPIIDVASRNALGTPFNASFGSFSPDNARYLASDGVRLALLNGANGQGVPGLAAGTIGSMPDWSPDGTRAVFSRPQVVPPLAPTGHSGAADLMIMPWMGAEFGAATTLLRSTGINNYYPCFSPDNRWVLFNRASGESSSNLGAQLWVTAADGSGEPIRLTRADGGDANGNSWPKWTPFVERTGGEVDEPLLWFTFTSRRDYGLRIQQQGRAPGDRTSQLWMAAFRPTTRGGDPSTPAFWLPFQNLDQGNHIAQWVPSLQRQDCGGGMACSNGETCIGGRCIGAPP